MVSVAIPGTDWITYIKWVKPSPLWAFEDTDISKPWLIEFKSDRFLPDFLDLVKGEVPDKLSDDLHNKAPEKTDIDGRGTMQLKLYQPLHQRYYLVTGSLVCRQFGLPDRTVVRKNGEKTSFVLRKTVIRTVGSITKEVELGWINNGLEKGWQDLIEHGKAVDIRGDEERLPLHAVKVPCASFSVYPQGGPQSQTTNVAQRTIYYGYIPVDSREKYLTPFKDTTIISAIESATDFHLGDVTERVINPWKQLYNSVKASDGNIPEQKDTLSLFVILDLGDFLKRILPDVYQALDTEGKSLEESKPGQKALFDELTSVYLPAPTPEDPSHEITLAEALYTLKDKLSLVEGQGDMPTDIYMIYKAYKKVGDPPQQVQIDPNTDLTPVIELFHQALDEAKTAVNIPDDVKDMIKNDPLGGDSYFLRLVYEHGPCAPVVSARSDSFTFAKFFDPDAPARHIRIELPSIKLKDLRKFKRGVGMQSSCELNKLTSMLSLDGVMNNAISLPAPCSPGLDMAIICSFSLPIITLVAFIVMFIFLILLNIVFWWLPFLKICFPVPKGE